jgi:hypothetical protein
MIPFSFTIELPPSHLEQKSGGFVLPKKEIIPVGKETFAAVKAAVLAIKKISDRNHHDGQQTR